MRFEQPLDAVETGVDRGEEVALLLFDHLRPRASVVSLSSGYGLLHHLGHQRHELVQERLVDADLPAVEHGAAQQALDDVFLFVRPGIDVFVDRERAGPHVVGDAPQPAAVFAGRIVLHAAHFARRFDQRPQDVDVKVGGRRLAAPTAVRSSPMPVSMFLLGSGRRLFGGAPTRLNCVNTRFQISTSLLPSGLIEDFAARAADAVGALAGGAGGPEVVVLAHPLDLARAAA